MSLSSEYTVSDVAILQARSCGFYTNAEARLRGLASQAAPTMHPAGNAAYGPFVLLMKGKHVLSITMIGPQPVDDRPVTACKLCEGLMTRPIRTLLEGREGLAYRPCPRAFDASKPICDTMEKIK